MMISKELLDKGLISKHSVSNWIIDNCQYEARCGSFSYGVNTSSSDIDIVGFTIPPKELIFPHLDGEILGFGNQKKRFESFQQHHIKDENNEKEYDVTIYSIVKFFHLCMENNPNMIDSLFVNDKCITHLSPIGKHVRDNRNIFLHKGCWHKFKGYAYSQKTKMLTRNPIGKRKEDYDKFNYDLKYAYHLVRLILEVEEILTEGTLTLDRNSRQLTSIRNGGWELSDILSLFDSKEKELESAYNNCTCIPYSPNEGKIKRLLLECLEMQYGKIDFFVPNISETTKFIIEELENLVEKYKYQ